MTIIKKKEIYLDHASSTPLDPTVLKVMYEYDKENFANPSAIYTTGASAKKRLEHERTLLANKLQVQSGELYFTSGGTESDNLALRGVVLAFKKDFPDRMPNIIVSAIEHAAVLGTARVLQSEGVKLSIVEVNSLGIIRPLDVINLIDKDTILVSVMSVNNEVGTIQPVGAIGGLIQKLRSDNSSVYPYFHVDACQAANYELVTPARYKADLLSINGSKIYGPKGIGLLYVSRIVKIESVLTGGLQERGLRSGTENIALVIGLTQAFIKAQDMRLSESDRLKVIQKNTILSIRKRFPDFTLNGSIDNRVPNNINITVPGIPAEELVIRLDTYGLQVSSKSACSAQDQDGSYVILAMGGTIQEARQTLRVTMGRSTQEEDLEYLLDKLEYITQNYI